MASELGASPPRGDGNGDVGVNAGGGGRVKWDAAIKKTKVLKYMQSRRVEMSSRLGMSSLALPDVWHQLLEEMHAATIKIADKKQVCEHNHIDIDIDTDPQPHTPYVIIHILIDTHGFSSQGRRRVQR